ncbi:MAG TPA: hypothetical protein VND64_26570 [Pirellulales bacterium]|nr:hypothetical protein [Pirellulales bacterium]
MDRTRLRLGGLLIVHIIAVFALGQFDHPVGIAGLWVKSTLVLVLALALGLLSTYCFAPCFSDALDDNWYNMPVFLLAQSIFTMASLFVIRSCG